jgi:putative transposase
VSPTLISSVTEAVIEEVNSWQSPPLHLVYPIVSLGHPVVKMREAGHVRNRADLRSDRRQYARQQGLPGLHAGQAEGAKFYLEVLTGLTNPAGPIHASPAWMG